MKKSWKKKAAMGAVCAAASAGVLIGSTFDTPADLLPDNPAFTAEADDTEHSEERRSVRRWFLYLPASVRILLCVPLWGLGWCILFALELLWQGLLTPLGSRAIGWLLATALTVGVFAAVVHAIAPSIPLKKILKKRNIFVIIFIMLILFVADALLTLVWTDYPPISLALRLIGGSVLILCGTLALRKLANPSKSIQQQALELADSVCPPRCQAVKK